jgi:hypothetical protein
MLQRQHKSILERLSPYVKPIMPNVALRKFHYFGITIFETKSYEIWLILQNLLYQIAPRKLLEFGAGRSTDFLAEYANKQKAEFLSIEESLVYCFRVKLALRCLFLQPNVVKHIPVRGSWYKEAALKKTLQAFDGFDFILIDGPSEYISGKRDSAMFYEHVMPRAGDLKLVVVDDVHRAHCAELARHIAREFDMKRYDISYLPRLGNVLAFLIGRKSAHAVDELPSPLARHLIPVD